MLLRASPLWYQEGVMASVHLVTIFSKNARQGLAKSIPCFSHANTKFLINKHHQTYRLVVFANADRGLRLP